ncbi:antitoxin [Cellulomonas sp.]|uniref:antitoxin n=1 Tax=Cellulomonas sp. TaxID=40001 RepID=UPI002D36FDD8|nr:antitoxin [Cellulomonas sp.]HYQ73599.1 antitoxin [Cellulomonas sp.]
MSLSERVTVTVPVPDLDFLREYERSHGLASRSAAFHAAIAALREKELESQYLEADEEWYASDDAAAWDQTSGDGLGGTG